MIRQVAHLCFHVRDLDRAIAFYTETLGMEKAFDFLDDEGRRFGVYLHVGNGTFVELFVNPEHTGAAGTASYKHFCLQVDDLENMVRELRESGVDVSDPKLGSDDSWQAWLTDPDGNAIELHQYTETSRQAPWVK